MRSGGVERVNVVDVVDESFLQARCSFIVYADARARTRLSRDLSTSLNEDG